MRVKHVVPGLVVGLLGGLWFTARAQAAGGAQRMSYDEVRARVFAQPLEKPVDYPPVSVFSILQMAATGKGAAADRANALFFERTDFKPRAVKTTHAPGVCADATWDITQDGGTGLFAKGTHMPALVRLSVATNDAVYAGQARSFALALKFFPAASTADQTLSVNLALSDQFGINGQDRPLFLVSPPQHGPIKFMNHIWGSGSVAELVGRAFSRVDSQPGTRPTYPLASVDQKGAAVLSVQAPRTVHLVLRPLPHAPQPTADVRDELRQYKPGEIVMDVELPPQKDFPEGARIGTLTVGEMVVSIACDEELSFYHHPNNPADEAH